MPTKRRKQITPMEQKSADRAARDQGEDLEAGPSHAPEETSESALGPAVPENDAEVFLDTDEEMPDESLETITGLGGQRTTGHGFAGGYNALKSYKGQYYSGMAVGGSHVWNYDEGVWKETKEEPDLWKIDYRTNKRRARKAPRGSGAPVGTEYHWLIVGHQHVKKVDANTYETSLTGSKYKLAYKSATANTWSIPTVKKQREREIELLEDAKLRVRGLPPVMASEKVKVEKQEKGQTKLDAMFSRAEVGGKKRKAEE